MSEQRQFTEQFWKEALDSARQGVWDYDIATGVKNYSDTWREIRGLKPGLREPETDEEWLQAVHPDDRELARSQTQLLNDGDLGEVVYEYRERHADGHWIWIMCRGRPVSWGENGKPTRFVGTDTDITPLKESEERVKAVSRRLELALASVQIGIFQFDVTRQTVEWDARLRSIYGLPDDDAPLPRDAWERALHPDDFAMATRIAYDALRKGQDYEIEYRIIRKDGAVRFLRSRVSYQHDLSGGPLLIGINWDATDDYEHALALQKANDLAAVRYSELEAARASMEHSSLHDALTGLPNRRMLEKAQMETFAALGKEGQRMAILLLDHDRFKLINDVFGHDAGDFVLQNTARVLQDGVPPGAVVVRVGGDEFAIFIPDAGDDDDLRRLAEGLIGSVAQPLRYEGIDCRYGISIGIAVADAGALDGKTLFVNADLALYRAKADGRGRPCFFTDDLRSAALAQRQLSDDILTGLDRDEFYCVYQPQFHAVTRRITGVEALVRWRSAHRGILLPADFLATAEDMNVLAKIDQIVLRKAVSDFNRWTEAGLQVPRLSINLSKPRLCEPQLEQELRDLPIDHTRLSFELLESNYLDAQSDVVSGNLAMIRRMGIGIEVDDFGTGHASILSLLKLMPDRLKIDRALVESIASVELQRQLVRSIVEIGHLLGISIIAEGVESEAQRAHLQDMDCDEIQGFFLARPMDAEGIAEFMQSRGRSDGNLRQRRTALLTKASR